MSKKQCTVEVSHSNVKVEENSRKAVFKNPTREKYQVTEVDGCLIEEGSKCDYLVSKKGVASVLIELKGTDVSHACDQLFTSAEHESVKPLLQNKKGFLVICSKYPRFDSFVAKAKQKAAKQYKAGFHVITDKGEFDINRVVDIDGPY